MARLSTHVLDTSRGKPAAGVVVDLHVVQSDKRLHLKTAITNDDGRTDEPLLPEVEIGIYELTFHAGDYFRAQGIELSSPPFLDEIVIRFGIGDTMRHYHVPLLLSPHGYSTYRGS